MGCNTDVAEFGNVLTHGIENGMFFVVYWGCKITNKMADYKKLYRSRDKKLCGVCGGLAEYFDLDPTLLRLLWIILTFASCSLGLIAYLVCALIVPQKPDNMA